jgi:hypothetical protein
MPNAPRGVPPAQSPVVPNLSHTTHEQLGEGLEGVGGLLTLPALLSSSLAAFTPFTLSCLVLGKGIRTKHTHTLTPLHTVLLLPPTCREHTMPEENSPQPLPTHC